MLKLAIVEDSDADAEALEKNLKESLGSLNTEFSADRYRSAEEFRGDGREYDVIFLDIEMPGMNGIELAEKIREANSESGIVFVTNMVRYAVRGYGVSPIDYIVKPIERYDFDITMKRVADFCERKHSLESILIRTKDGARKLSYRQIRYIEVSLHHIVIYTDEESIDMWGSLTDLEAKLPTETFFRLSSSTIVNLGYVKGIKGYDADVGGKTLRVARPKKRELMAALVEYYGR